MKKKLGQSLSIIMKKKKRKGQAANDSLSPFGAYHLFLMTYHYFFHSAAKAEATKTDE
jgi:hypothetical protein